MHGSFRENFGLDETGQPYELGQTRADIVVLSFSDSDLGAFAAGWRAAKSTLPTVRLASLVALAHPMSVDMYIDQTLQGAKAILVRLIGGESYWSYGLQQTADLARRNGIALAVLPADGRVDGRLDALSTLPIANLRRLAALCDMGGAHAAETALRELAIAAGFVVEAGDGAAGVPAYGWYDPAFGVLDHQPTFHAPVVAITFYRSYIVAADLEPINALIEGFRLQGFDAISLFVPSLKDSVAAAWIAAVLCELAPCAVVNATAFSARGDDGVSPLDGAGCPVFQVALSTARKRDWVASDRGLSAGDLAMHVVLPEVDGRIFAGVVSFKYPSRRDPDLQFSRFVHRAYAPGVSGVVNRVSAWARLATLAPPERRIAVVLSTYPGRADQMAHAVGLDALASTEAILGDLAAENYATSAGGDLAAQLATQTLSWPIVAYQAALERLPQALRDSLTVAWGAPENDAAVHCGHIHFSALWRGSVLVALQPERGRPTGRDGDYHDLSQTPRHSYVAFYLWLQEQCIDALVHVGAHGTLEWLPGKSVALSANCWPAALIGDVPVIYPFIVNDPGEAAQAKRRIGAVTLGHQPPPLTASAVPSNLRALEQLLDEYSTADGLDPARRTRLIGLIRTEAQSAGVEQDLGLAANAGAIEAMVAIDRFVCDLKASQFGDGLHVYGQGPGERDGLLTALRGGRVPAGPAGSPWRGHSDVLPTGRNLYSVDPRAVPTRTAHAQGVKLAEELLRRYLQDHGDWPRALIVDLWGSATMRTAGEEFAMALHLMGLAPRWDALSDRVGGVVVVSLKDLGRPRVDVTLRVSGLFRDVFPGLAVLFEVGAAALAQADGPDMATPFAAKSPRVFGPRPGGYGLAIDTSLADLSDEGRLVQGEAWLAGSEWTIDASGRAQRDRVGLEARVIGADGFAHVQDLTETDVLMASDYAAHEGGFAAAVARLGRPAPRLYHIDSSRPDAPQARPLTQEIARVVRARAANPNWANGMMRHGFRGAAELTATLDHLAAFAHLTRTVPGHLFDLYHDATLGRPDVVAFMAQENPGALAELRARFQSVHQAGLWTTRRNSIAASFGAAHD